MNSIEISNLTKKYGNFYAVDGLSFTVGQGDFLGFLGVNGAGKSTTVNMLSTILTPDGGTAFLNGYRLGKDVNIDLESKLVKTIPKPTGINYVINTDLQPGESKTTVKAREGYVVETYKIWDRGNKEERRELLFTTTYKAYQETVEHNPR